MKRITSAQNPEVKARAKLKERRGRTKEGKFLVEGARELARALGAGVGLEALYVCRELLNEAGQAVLRDAETRGVPLTELSEPAFRALSMRENPDGVVGVALKQEKRLADLTLPEDALVVVCEGVEKPGNLGALLRTADGVGVHAVFTTGGGTDLENPNVVRSSMGSVFSRPVLTADGDELRAWLRQEGFTLVAATPHTDRLYWNGEYRGKTALLLGAEDKGLSAAWLGAADLRVKIPMRGLADSLNVATAGALLLYEALRQRLEPPAR